MAKRGTKRVLEYARLAMGFANVRAGTQVLMLVLVLVAGLFSEADDQSNAALVRVLRALRSLRPLRVVGHLHGMRVLVATIIDALPSVLTVSCCLLYFVSIVVSNLPFNIRREGGQSLVIGASSLVILEGREGIPL